MLTIVLLLGEPQALNKKMMMMMTTMRRIRQKRKNSVEESKMVPIVYYVFRNFVARKTFHFHIETNSHSVTGISNWYGN